MRVLVIIPAYNEEDSILSVVQNVVVAGYDYVVINDGSRDGTLELCREHGLNVLDLPRNLGIGGAIQAGHLYARQTALRRAGIRWLSWWIRLFCRERVTDPTSGFRASGSRAIELFCETYPVDYPEPESIVTALKSGLTVREAPVIMHERQGGISSISPLSSVYYMVKVTLAIAISALTIISQRKR